MTSKMLIEFEPLVRKDLKYPDPNGPISEVYKCPKSPCDPSQVSEKKPAGLDPLYNLTKYILDLVGTKGNYTEEYKVIGKNELVFWPMESQVYDYKPTRCCEDACSGTSNAGYFHYVYSSPLGASSVVKSVIDSPWQEGTTVSAGSVVDGFPKIALTPLAPFTYKPNEFKSDGKVYVVLKYAPLKCKNQKDQYVTYTVDVKVYIYLDSDVDFFARCCASIDINADERKYFCPKKYSGDKLECPDLMNNYCNQTNPTTALEPICGCYPYYIKKKVVDPSPAMKKWLGDRQLPPRCSASCAQGLAYIPPDPGNCDLTICVAEVNNVKGKIITGKGGVKITQNCGGPQPSPPTPSKRKIELILGIVGGVILLLFLFIILLVVIR